MRLFLQATIFDGNTLSIRGTYPIATYSLLMDAISNSTSTFVIPKDITIESGDYIAVKEQTSSNLIYYGQITTIDQSDDIETITITSNYIWNILNGEIVVKSITGNSYEQHLINIIKKYIDSNNTISPLRYSITNSTNTAFSVTNSDGLSTSNLIDYMIRGFKLHNTPFNLKGIGTNINSKGIPIYYPEIDISQVTDTWNFRNNIYDFYGWTVTDSRGLRGYNNELWIVDKASPSMENPTIMAKYFLQKDGSVVKTLNDNVTTPTQVHIYIYDKTATDNPTLDSIAKTELQGNSYSHNIQFSAPINNNFLPIEKIKLGLQSNIYYNDKQYKSILTSYSINSDSENISLTFGNLRFGRNDLFSNSN